MDKIKFMAFVHNGIYAANLLSGQKLIERQIVSIFSRERSHWVKSSRK